MIGTSQDGVQTAVIAMKSPIATITQPAMTVNTGVASHDGGDRVATNGLMEDTPVPGF